MKPKALMVGNSDGMGLAMTRRLLNRGWEVLGISRSQSPVTHTDYRHRVEDVSNTTYTGLLEELSQAGPFDLCCYFAQNGGRCLNS